MEVGIAQIVALIGTVASVLCTVIVGSLSYFLKKTLSGLEDADKKNAAQIEKVEEKLNDLKADLPLIYVTREDYIRIMNRVEDKLDQLLYSNNSTPKTTKEKEE